MIVEVAVGAAVGVMAGVTVGVTVGAPPLEERQALLEETLPTRRLTQHSLRDRIESILTSPPLQQIVLPIQQPGFATLTRLMRKIQRPQQPATTGSFPPSVVLTIIQYPQQTILSHFLSQMPLYPSQKPVPTKRLTIFK